MRRMISVVAAMAVMAAMLVAMSAPAFAVQGGLANDDKNNWTAPGQGAGNKTFDPNQPAWQNRNEHCQERWDSGDRPGDGLPAQCYTSPTEQE